MKCPEEEERGQEASVDDPGFSSEGPGQSKLAGSRRSCHSFPPATEPSAASAPRHGRDPRLPATSSEARGGTRAPRQTQELGGGRGPAQTRVRPLSFPTKKRQECSAKSPAPQTGNHSLFYQHDPTGRPPLRLPQEEERRARNLFISCGFIFSAFKIMLLSPCPPAGTEQVGINRSTAPLGL